MKNNIFLKKLKLKLKLKGIDYRLQIKIDSLLQANFGYQYISKFHNIQLMFYQNNNLMLQLVITYIWFGLIIPQEYMVLLSQVNYPTRILINPPLQNTLLKQDTYKSDRYILQVLKKGGLYSDFNNKINYTCLMQEIQNFNGQMAISDRKNLIYVPLNKTRLINKILDEYSKQLERCDRGEVNCKKLGFINKYKQDITILNLSKCILQYIFVSNSDNQTNPKTPEQLSNSIIIKQVMKKKKILQEIQEHKNSISILNLQQKILETKINTTLIKKQQSIKKIKILDKKIEQRQKKIMNLLKKNSPNCQLNQKLDINKKQLSKQLYQYSDNLFKIINENQQNLYQLIKNFQQNQMKKEINYTQNDKQQKVNLQQQKNKMVLDSIIIILEPFVFLIIVFILLILIFVIWFSVAVISKLKNKYK